LSTYSNNKIDFSEEVFFEKKEKKHTEKPRPAKEKTAEAATREKNKTHGAPCFFQKFSVDRKKRRQYNEKCAVIEQRLKSQLREGRFRPSAVE